MTKKTKNTIANIVAKKNLEKLVCLTAYSFPMAKILDEFCDILLVGDSLGMTIYGHKDTLSVTTQMMIDHTKAVVKATKHALIITDLPFNTYEKSKEQALKTAQKIIKETGCDAVKLETTKEIIPIIEFLVKNKINVCAHVGLLPQHIKEYGGYKYQGKTKEAAKEILEVSQEAQKAGAFAVVIEGTPKELADKITKKLKIPTIGIGASVNCDGQILVIDDLLGLNQEFKPKFVKNYCDLSKEIKAAVKCYSKEVKTKKFPAKENQI